MSAHAPHLRTFGRIPSRASETSQLLQLRLDPSYGAFWCSIKESAPSSFSPALLAALRDVQRMLQEQVRTEVEMNVGDRIRFQILSSHIPGIFSLGGDLDLLQRLIRTKHRAGLFRYAQECIDLVYWTAVSYRLPVTTVSLIQGRALGGGLEAALAANVVVAERKSTMGFPEVLFNLFPGMGALSLMARRIPLRQAEKIIESGKLFCAEEFHELGLVDVLAEDDEGEAVVTRYVRQAVKKDIGCFGMRRAAQAVHPLRYDELLEVAETWVDSALGLNETDLRVMERMSKAQQRRSLR